MLMITFNFIFPRNHTPATQSTQAQVTVASLGDQHDRPESGIRGVGGCTSMNRAFPRRNPAEQARSSIITCRQGRADLPNAKQSCKSQRFAFVVCPSLVTRHSSLFFSTGHLSLLLAAAPALSTTASFPLLTRGRARPSARLETFVDPNTNHKPVTFMVHLFVREPSLGLGVHFWCKFCPTMRRQLYRSRSCAIMLSTRIIHWARARPECSKRPWEWSGATPMY